MLAYILTAWLVGAVVAFGVWLVAAMRARSRDFRHMWAPALLTAVVWPVVLVAGPLVWLGGLISARLRRKDD